tara:strand:+ start:2920 stop:4284 length:1365 start_codon:yes stop_codon:yes gene_type:complete
MRFIETLKNIWKISELKNRIFFTLIILAVYRFGSQIVLPGIDVEAASGLGNKGEGILGLLDAFTGGALAQASVFALGIMPYISASIVVQLMGIAIPYLQKLQKEGASGQKKITQITRWLTIGICLLQAPAYLASLEFLGVQRFITDPDTGEIIRRGIDTMELGGFWFGATSTIFLVTGCIFAMWLGEKITDKGIGNGISILITVGIIATLVPGYTNAFDDRVDTASEMMIFVEIVVWLAIILACVMLVMAVRKIVVQYARRSASGSFDRNMATKRQYIPLKLNASGVMPIIFAQALMFLPGTLGEYLGITWLSTNFANIFGFWYNIVFGLLIIVFTYFYTAITVPTNKIADDLKRGGGFIPGVRPGSETSNVLDIIMSNITLPGSIFLALIAVFPAFVFNFMEVNQSWALFFGGTSLLIMVGVAIDTMQQVNSYLLNKHYDGLMKSGRDRKPAI